MQEQVTIELGTLSLCSYCGAIEVYRGEGRWAPAEPLDLASLRPEDLEMLQETQRRIRERAGRS